MIHRLAIILIGIVLCVQTSVSQQPPVSEADRRQDIYAVYSTIFANPDFNDRIFLVAAKTVPVEPLTPADPKSVLSLVSPEGCFQIPPAYAVAWQEIQSELGVRKNSPGAIDDAFRERCGRKVATKTRLGHLLLHVVIRNEGMRGLSPVSPHCLS